MTILGRGPLDQNRAGGGFELFGRRDEASQVVLRSQSGRAYAFEVHPQEAVCDLAEVSAVYCYARAVPVTSADASGTGLQIGHGSRLVATSKVFTTGEFTQTQAQMDVAIKGDGFFEVQLPNGERAYTRDGSLKVVTVTGKPKKSL